MRFWLVIAITLAIGSGASVARADEEWVRAEHPELPLSFEAPPDTGVQTAQTWLLGAPRRREGPAHEIRLFGIRPTDPKRPRFHALEFAFFWLDEKDQGAEAATLDALAKSPGDAPAMERFLRAALYAKSPAIELWDRGAEVVDGRPARRFGLRARVALGTRDERATEGQVVLAPVPPGAALAIVGRFDPAASGDEREALFLRIVGSVRIGEHAPDAVPAVYRGRAER